MKTVSKSLLFLAAATSFVFMKPAFAQKTLTAAMHSDLKILDPVWTTAFITRSHGYMIYDTLFAQDEKGLIQPQMVDKYTISADGLTYNFTLREGLKFHDGKPVTSEDVIPSIKRWAVKNVIGQRFAGLIDAYTAIDANSFSLKLKEPSSFILFALGNQSAPFIMPKSVAETDPNKQLDNYIGSGPFTFNRDDWKPGEQTLYRKNTAYIPRKEPASGLAGGKNVKFDQVIWKVMGDPQQMVNALQRNEIDLIEQPSTDLFEVVKADKAMKIVNFYPPGFQYAFRFNHLHKPFDNPKIRQVLLYAFNQSDFLEGSFGDKALYKTCKALFGCDLPYESTVGMEGGILEGDLAKARSLLKESGYDGTPIVLMQSTDLPALTNLAPIAKQAMEKVGFKVDMQSMDWQTLVSRRAKKDAPNAGGWNAMLTAWGASDIFSPLTMVFLNASCDKAVFGWPCDAEIEKLRDDFAREMDFSKQKAIVDKIQIRWREAPTHIHLGQYVRPFVSRANIDGFVVASFVAFWNFDRK